MTTSQFFNCLLLVLNLAVMAFNAGELHAWKKETKRHADHVQELIKVHEATMEALDNAAEDDTN